MSKRIKSPDGGFLDDKPVVKPAEIIHVKEKVIPTKTETVKRKPGRPKGRPKSK